MPPYLKIFLFFNFFVLFFTALNFVNAQQIPTGVPISLDSIILISENIGGFLMVLGGILAGIAVVWAGIAYMTSGSDSARVKAAKDILKAGIIGAAIIFGSGVIVNTIKAFAGDPLKFFK